MSYNISRWTTKELTDLRISIAALTDCEELDAPTIDLKTNELLFEGLSEGFELRGKRDGDVLVVKHISHSGTGSGRNHDDLKTILAESTGTLVAVLVWENGDTIERLVVRDGVIAVEAVEL